MSSWRASGPESRRASASAPMTFRARLCTARSPASGSRDDTPREPATTSITSAGRGCSRTPAPEWPPVQVADLAAGALGAVTEILAALLEPASAQVKEHTSRLDDAIARTTSSRTASAASRCPQMLTGGLACYRTYATGDGRHLTVGALEPKFFARLCELVDRPELGERQYAADQDELAGELSEIFAARSLAEWLAHFGEEDVCVGPVWTREEAAAAFGSPSQRTRARAWRAHRGLAPRVGPGQGMPATYDAERPRAAGSARRVSIRSGSSGRKPSRSSRIARMPSARAPSMSSS